MAAFVYERGRPERTTLYAVVRDNIKTLYAAESGVELPRFVRAELEGYLDCGLLRRGFAHPGDASISRGGACILQETVRSERRGRRDAADLERPSV